MKGIMKSLATVIASVLGIAAIAAILSTTVWADQNVVRLFEDGRRQLRAGKSQEAIAAFTKVLEMAPHTERNAHTIKLARAQAYISHGDLAKAAGDISDILRGSRTDGEMRTRALNLRGHLNFKRGKNDDALKSFTEAIKTAHENDALRAECFADRGAAYVRIERNDKAISDLTKAIELNPRYGYAYAVRAMAYLRSDRIEAAKRDGEQALKMDAGKPTEKMAREVLKELSAFSSGPLSVSVPLDKRGHVLVQVRFSKKGEPHLFMLDTGATNTVIDEGLLKQISQETEVTHLGKSKARIADGSTITVTRYRVKTAFLYHLPLGEIEVHVVDRPSGKMNNLLGTRSVRNLAVTIDNSKRMAEIRRTDSEANSGSIEE